MSASSLGLMIASCSGSGGSVGLSLHDQTVLVELTDGASRVGKGDFVGLVRVDPHSLLSALQDCCSKSLLLSKLSHARSE